ncbi:hypothetical protein Rcae01_01296 [Novipirellula caenicola]|uniref:Uncharacterized protein n=1 Tax=Novipirellula caenicola TaxID=1536901 RepID=A0ABP9VNV1_9BACT
MMDFLVHPRRIRRTRKSIVRLKQQAVDGFRYDKSVIGLGVLADLARRLFSWRCMGLDVVDAFDLFLFGIHLGFAQFIQL